jgi:competence protein ComEC
MDASPALLGAVLGPALQLQQAVLWPLPVYVAFVAAGLVLVGLPAIKTIAFSRWPSALRVLWVVLAVAAASGGLCGWRAAAFDQQRLDPRLQGVDLELTGVIRAMPQSSEPGLRFRLAVESAHRGGEPVSVPPEVMLGWYGGVTTGPQGAQLQRVPPTLRAGERWALTARLKAPHGNRNPHGFDYELWLWDQGVQATGYVRAGPNDPAPRRLGQTGRHPVERARQAVRDAVFERLAGAAGSGPTGRRLAGVVAALVTGDQAAIERPDWDVFRATGVAHLMSISGLHVTMFAWVAAAVVGWAWRRSGRLSLRLPAPTAGRLAGVAAALAYALFSGWGVPAQRTVWMLATVVALGLAGRRWPWPQVWLLVLAVVTVVDPWALLQPGFWLSFVAVGVLFATDSGAGQQAPMGPAARFNALLREQGVVTVALAPLTLLLFGQVSLVGLVANLLAVPWVTLVVTPLGLLGVLAPPLWDLAALAVDGLGRVLGWFAGWPWATLFLARAPLWAGVAGLAGGVLLVWRLPLPLRLLGVPLMLPVLLWQPQRPPQGAFELLAADIGQGNAVLVRTAAHTLLYDAGPRYSPEADAGHRVVVPLLRATAERVDTLVLSHRDSDHTGGAAAVLAQQPQAALWSSIESEHELQAARAVKRCVAGQRWRWDGVDFEILHPRAGDYEGAPKPNAVSCVLRVSGGGRAALLAGDIEREQEARLASDASDAATGAPSLRADVLLVPHHGSKTSSSDALLDAVRPRLALVQAGYRNRFGHPAAEVMARYRERAIRVVASPECGAARWSSLTPGEVQCERDNAPRYWQYREQGPRAPESGAPSPR